MATAFTVSELSRGTQKRGVKLHTSHPVKVNIHVFKIIFEDSSSYTLIKILGLNITLTEKLSKR